ncbi:MAG TPA: nucleotidyltransferase family protein [Longimicrobiales bacterium]
MTSRVPAPARAVILAAGRGTRMRRTPPGVALDDAQRSMADRGLKPLVPFHGHAYLDYVLSALADGGCGEACVVVPRDDDTIRARYAAIGTRRIRLSFATQHEPLGSAHALLAAEAFIGDDEFLVVNADNVYPPGAVAALLDVRGNALAGFRRDALVAGGIPPERIAAYALVRADAEGCLAEVVEKPGPEELRRFGGDALISMTLWRFTPAIFDACRRIAPSARGEYELPDAVSYATRVLGERFRIVPVDGGVLDLSCREDIPLVAERLRGVRVEL